MTAAAADNAGSGAYLEHVFRHTAASLYGVHLPADQPLQYKQGRNVDFQEVELVVGGAVVLRGALAYGFRNMQVSVCTSCSCVYLSKHSEFEVTRCMVAFVVIIIISQ